MRGASSGRMHVIGLPGFSFYCFFALFLIGHFPKLFLLPLSHMSLIHMSINPSKFGVTLVRFGVGEVVVKVCVVA